MTDVDPGGHARLPIVLAEVIQTIEGLMHSGLTSVSPSIVDDFQSAFEHAAKCQQLRLSSNLRLVNRELKYFFDDDSRFSEKQFSRFLNRCWHLSRRIAQPERFNNTAPSNTTEQLDTSQPKAVETLNAAIHGVIKKTVPGVFCALEFRLHNLDNTDPYNKPLLWSCVLATPPDSKITPESLLSFDQPQQFKPSIFLESPVTLRNIHLAEDETGIRIRLNNQSEVFASEMAQQVVADPKNRSLETLASRLQNWTPTPLDLETQPQLETYLSHWRIDEEFIHPGLDHKILFPLYTNNKQLFIVIDNNDDGKGQLSYFRHLLKENKQLIDDWLFGLMHFEQGLCLFQPLTLWSADQPPKHLMITKDQSDYAALLKILKEQ